MVQNKPVLVVDDVRGGGMEGLIKAVEEVATAAGAGVECEENNLW